MKIESFLDELFRTFIRLRAIKLVHGCERCKHPKYDKQKENGDILPAWKQLQCSHFWGRGKHSTRWDEDNAVGLCGGCHMYFTANPEEHREWFVNHLGQEGYEILNARARVPARYIDKEAILLYLEAQIKEL